MSKLFLIFSISITTLLFSSHGFSKTRALITNPPKWLKNVCQEGQVSQPDCPLHPHQVVFGKSRFKAKQGGGWKVMNPVSVRLQKVEGDSTEDLKVITNLKGTKSNLRSRITNWVQEFEQENSKAIILELEKAQKLTETSTNPPVTDAQLLECLIKEKIVKGDGDEVLIHQFSNEKLGEIEDDIDLQRQREEEFENTYGAAEVDESIIDSISEATLNLAEIGEEYLGDELLKQVQSLFRFDADFGGLNLDVRTKRHIYKHNEPTQEGGPLKVYYIIDRVSVKLGTEFDFLRAYILKYPGGGFSIGLDGSIYFELSEIRKMKAHDVRAGERLENLQEKAKEIKEKIKNLLLSHKEDFDVDPTAGTEEIDGKPILSGENQAKLSKLHRLVLGAVEVPFNSEMAKKVKPFRTKKLGTTVSGGVNLQLSYGEYQPGSLIANAYVYIGGRVFKGAKLTTTATPRPSKNDPTKTRYMDLKIRLESNQGHSIRIGTEARTTDLAEELVGVDLIPIRFGFRPYEARLSSTDIQAVVYHYRFDLETESGREAYDRAYLGNFEFAEKLKGKGGVELIDIKLELAEHDRMENKQTLVFNAYKKNKSETRANEIIHFSSIADMDKAIKEMKEAEDLNDHKMYPNSRISGTTIPVDNKLKVFRNIEEQKRSIGFSLNLDDQGQVTNEKMDISFKFRDKVLNKSEYAAFVGEIQEVSEDVMTQAGIPKRVPESFNKKNAEIDLTMAYSLTNDQFQRAFLDADDEKIKQIIANSYDIDPESIRKDGGVLNFLRRVTSQTGAVVREAGQFLTGEESHDLGGYKEALNTYERWKRIQSTENGREKRDLINDFFTDHPRRKQDILQQALEGEDIDLVFSGKTPFEDKVQGTAKLNTTGESHLRDLDELGETRQALIRGPRSQHSSRTFQKKKEPLIIESDLQVSHLDVQNEVVKSDGKKDKTSPVITVSTSKEPMFVAVQVTKKSGWFGYKSSETFYIDRNELDYSDGNVSIKPNKEMEKWLDGKPITYVNVQYSDDGENWSKSFSNRPKVESKAMNRFKPQRRR
ncbi:MAG: hypothetical protein ACPGJV_03605 [Bacteriovoracaceae bacterium]